MAFANSGVYLLNAIDKYDATQLAVDLSLDSHKWALYTNSATPNFSSDTVYSATNEVSGTGYSAGGKAITGLSPTVTESPTGTMKYTHGNLSWSGATITARGGELYLDALTGDPLFLALTFGADIVSTAGVWTLAPAAGGLLTIDWTP